MDINKFGYYVVDNKKFFSKIQACMYATEKNLSVDNLKWYYHDDRFNLVDWKTEPEQTLDQLYDARALDIRFKYDYVVLSYSGGADSHNIFEAFNRQGLLIDEIVVHHFEKGRGPQSNFSKHDTSALNSTATEHYFHTLPMLKYISKVSPKTKITLVDMTDNMFEYFQNAKDENWVNTRTEQINPGNVTKYDYFKVLRKRLDVTRSMAVVLGTDKPRCFIRAADSNFYFRISDKSINSARSIADSLSIYSNSTLEYFYWSPDSAKMLVKQAHVVKRFLEKNPKYQIFFYSPNLTKEIWRYVHENILRTIVYSTWNTKWFQAEKNLREWSNEIDYWFISGAAGTDAREIWYAGKEKVEKNASIFVNEHNDGLISCSKNFNCGPINNLMEDLSTQTLGKDWTTDKNLLNSKFHR